MDCPSHPNEGFTECLQATFCPSIQTIMFLTQKLCTVVHRIAQSAVFACIFGLLGCMKHSSFYMMGSIQCIMRKKSTNYFKIVTSDQCCLLCFTVQTDGVFNFLEIDQIKDLISKAKKASNLISKAKKDYICEKIIDCDSSQELFRLSNQMMGTFRGTVLPSNIPPESLPDKFSDFC